MERVIIESPLSGDFTRNRRYALWCVAYRHLPFAALAAFQRGELPNATRGFK